MTQILTPTEAFNILQKEFGFEKDEDGLTIRRDETLWVSQYRRFYLELRIIFRGVESHFRILSLFYREGVYIQFNTDAGCIKVFKDED